ncbi:MAG: hypothetical protein LBP76_04000 [Treponema sp.]|jgi:antirestriction protein ArdC|nr:hypothetical protein [Treponema sp.]
MTENAKQILDNLVQEITAEKAVTFIRERLFCDDLTLPCKTWSRLNQFITFLSGTCDARGFRQWQKAGRSVKKGAKALYIIVPMIYKIKINPEDKDSAVEEKTTGFKAMPVFRVEDTEGAELDYEIRIKAFNPDSLPLIDVARSLGVSVSAGFTGNAAGFFRPSANAIVMGSNDGQTFLHELSHAVDYVLPDRNANRNFQEITAELSSAFLGSLYGVPVNIDNTTAYIRSWAGSGHVAFKIVEALGRVEEIYHYIEAVKTKAAA